MVPAVARSWRSLSSALGKLAGTEADPGEASSFTTAAVTVWKVALDSSRRQLTFLSPLHREPWLMPKEMIQPRASPASEMLTSHSSPEQDRRAKLNHSHELAPAEPDWCPRGRCPQASRSKTPRCQFISGSEPGCSGYVSNSGRGTGGEPTLQASISGDLLFLSSQCPC